MQDPLKTKKETSGKNIALKGGTLCIQAKGRSRGGHYWLRPQTTKKKKKSTDHSTHVAHLREWG